MRTTFHLVPVEAWADHLPGTPYLAGTLASEGFVHCTDGAAELLVTANRHYRDDARAFIALTIDLDAAGSPWSVEDEGGIYPHVFGPIDPSAILAQRPMLREAGGRFGGLGEATPLLEQRR